MRGSWKTPGHRKKHSRMAFTRVHSKNYLSVVRRVARFFLVQNTKTGKNIPIDEKIYQMIIKYFQ
jgi:hypothetical protein